MVMDFIGDQDKARRRTGVLVLLFSLAVLFTIGAIYFLVTASLIFSTSEDELARSWWQPMVLLYAGGATLSVILIGSLVKMSQLSSGGQVVAEALGGHLIHPDSRDPEERRVLNVVEEMAIASGCPVPPVYLIDDNSINAFAAGYTFDSAVIGVTRGCASTLTRDQLQGVMAHEFSHIVHGDMRLNIRLTGVIFGIMAIGFIGFVLFRFIGPSMLYSRGGSGKDNGAAVGLGVMVAGIALIIVGAIGTMCGRLIQAAVSRQREFLADASAVDYTRNPKGIAGALRRIGGLDDGNTLKQSAASEYQHFFFTSALSTMFSTHPPLEQRIERIENRPFEGEAMTDNVDVPAEGLSAAAAGFAAGGAAKGRNLQMRSADSVRETLSHLGTPDPVHLAYARAVLSLIPDKIREAVHDPIGAQATCLLLLVDSDKAVSKKQGQLLEDRLDKTLRHELVRLNPIVITAVQRSPELRMVLVDMAMPALSRLPSEHLDIFLMAIQDMIHADGHLDRFEWLLGRLLVRHVDHLRRGSSKEKNPRRPLKTMTVEARLILAMIAWSGARSEDQAVASFRASAGAAGLGNLDFPSRSDCSIPSLERALDSLSLLRFKDRGILLQAAVEGVCEDGMVTLAEVELLRALSSALDCPMPPVLPGNVDPAAA